MASTCVVNLSEFRDFDDFGYFCELVLTLFFPTGYTTGSAMYPTFSLLNHNCVCNTRTRKFLQDGNNIIELEAMVIIKKGQEICTRYVIAKYIRPSNM